MKQGPSVMAFMERSRIATSCRKNLSHWTTASGMAGLFNSQYISGTIFNKYATYQGRHMRNRKISKGNEDTYENNKTEA